MDIEEMKKAYNNALRASRAATKAAIRLRQAVIEADSSYSGSSLGKLEQAHELLTSARRFNID